MKNRPVVDPESLTDDELNRHRPPSYVDTPFEDLPPGLQKQILVHVSKERPPVEEVQEEVVEEPEPEIPDGN